MYDYQITISQMYELNPCRWAFYHYVNSMFLRKTQNPTTCQTITSSKLHNNNPSKIIDKNLLGWCKRHRSMRPYSQKQLCHIPSLSDVPLRSPTMHFVAPPRKKPCFLHVASLELRFKSFWLEGATVKFELSTFKTFGQMAL